MSKRFPARPAHPERICWGCDRYCPVDSMMCGNGSVATLHLFELFGEDWASWGSSSSPAASGPAACLSPQDLAAETQDRPEP